MRLLILGGTKFLGRHLVEATLRRGHAVSIFTRGQHNPELFPEVEKLRGDRDGNLEALRGKSWDAVIDTSGYVPRLVRDSAELLASSTALYVFISSLSVYADFSQPIEEERAPLATMPDESIEEVSGTTYGPLKVLCERAAEAAMPGRVLNIRPGLIVGPHDPTGRFTYWPRRIARGGEVLAPGRPSRPVQLIDVRDLSEWSVRMTEEGRTGNYNAVGPRESLTMEEMLAECARVSASDARLTWVDEKFLREQDVQAWAELPLWLPEEDGNFRHFFTVNTDRAFQSGLTVRPLSETIRDTLAWDEETRARPPVAAYAGKEAQPDPTLKPERERQLLEAWHRQEQGHQPS